MAKWLDFFRKHAGRPAGKLGLAAAVIIVSAAVAAVQFRDASTTAEKQTALKVIDDQVDLYIRDVHYTEVGDSGNRLEINADSATFLKKENLARFERVRMKLILPDGKPYELSADRGRLRTDLKDVDASPAGETGSTRIDCTTRTERRRSTRRTPSR